LYYCTTTCSMRHRAGRDLEAVATEPCQDPYHIFESVATHHGIKVLHSDNINNNSDKQQQQCCSGGCRRMLRRCCCCCCCCCSTKKSRFHCLVITWVLVGTIMAAISWQLMVQIHHAKVLEIYMTDLIQSMILQSDANRRRRKQNTTSTRNKPKKKNVVLKTILYWNHYWDFDHFQFGRGRKPFLDAQCPVNHCMAVQHDPTTFTNQQRATYDAILFHASQLDTSSADQDLLLANIQKWRKPNQRFVYMNMESPLSHSNSMGQSARYHHFFNWTMSYRLDSDLPRPYGFFVEHDNDTNQSYFPQQWHLDDFLPYKEDFFFQQIQQQQLPRTAFRSLAQRPKKVAWIVSRCQSPSHREDYVKELQKYIDVDIMGDCGDIPCNQSFHHHADVVTTSSTQQPTPDNCTKAVQRDYKFYLALENSFCPDYVTEKFFGRLQGNSPPLLVVLGGANYSRIAPPHSHLNILDYPSPKALAKVLYQLDRNQSLYLSYFWWMDHYRVHTGTAKDHASTMCRLCERLHEEEDDDAKKNDRIRTNTKVYPSIVDWHDQCQPPPQVIQALKRGNDDGRLLDD
jgi:alpha-1,3-fucosyltransferase